jgi:quinohemoprotein ethanol dehydrogenase
LCASIARTETGYRGDDEMIRSKLAWVVIAAGVSAASLWAQQAGRPSAVPSECCAPAGNDMPKGGGNLGNQRYSSLAAINLQNIRNLGAAWKINVSAVPPATDHLGTQSTPVVVDGVIFLNTPAGGVIAVDGATGTARWKWQPTAFQNAGNRRGVTVGEGKVFALGSNRIVALDQKTGAEVWVVQPKAPTGEAITGIGEVATVYHDGMVYVGTGNARHAIIAVKASDGSLVWTFNGIAEPGRVVTDVNGVTTDAGASWGSCAQRGGGDAWVHGAVDPELGMTYYTLSNARGCGGSQDASGREGQNLFANTLVALDLKTGAYKWHFQSIHQDIWDMDNVHAPLLADVVIGGQPRRAIYYGSKSGHLFVLDRANGKPLLRAEETPVPQDTRQHSPATQPIPNRPLPNCVAWQALDPKNVPGDPWRAVPNYNGYQPDASGKLVYTEANYLAADRPFVIYPPEYEAKHPKGCLYDTHWDLPVLSTSSQNGGPTWSTYSYSHKLGLIYFPYGVSPVAHWRGAGSNGLRPIGQYQTGGILAIDAATNTVKWNSPRGTDMGHGQNPLSTAGDLVFIGMVDGNFMALNAATGRELWRFQAGSAISAGPITYMINGEQYVAVFAAGGSLPYGNSVPRGDALWAFKLGGTYKTASGSSEAPAPPLVTVRRPVGGMPVEGSTVDNTVLLARASRTADTAEARDNVSTNAMIPTHLRVPVGTTVTILNPGAETFPNFPNQKLHCATQFFEGLFNAKLQPGQRFRFTFDRAGEYFFNDCTDPRPTGKIEVYHTPETVAGALTFAGDALDLRSPTGVFTGVTGTVVARFAMPAGYTFEGDAQLKLPLSEIPVPAVSARTEAGGRTVAIQFNKADIDNNLPTGANVPIVLSAHFRRAGAQKLLTATASVAVMK